MAFQVNGQDQGYWVGKLWIDVVVEEDHDESSDVAADPVELGTDIVDHIHAHARRVTIKGVVSNHPIKLPESHAAGARLSTTPLFIEGEPHSLQDVPQAPTGVLGVSFGQPLRLALAVAPDFRPRRKFEVKTVRFDREFDRVSEARRALSEARSTGALVELVLTGEAIANMVITNFSHQITADKGGADALHFSLSLQQVRFAATERGDVPLPVETRDKKATTSGAKPATDVTNDTDAASETSVLYRLLHGGG